MFYLAKSLFNLKSLRKHLLQSERPCTQHIVQGIQRPFTTHVMFHSEDKILKFSACFGSVFFEIA